MAEDFRTLLKEDMRDADSGERWFADFEIGEAFYLSVQTAPCTPASPRSCWNPSRNTGARMRERTTSGASI